jgi:hypothetical protein
MTVYKMCRRLHEILPTGIRQSLRFAGVLNTVQANNRAVSINSREVHKRLTTSIERIKRESAETIRRIQMALDLLEGK